MAEKLSDSVPDGLKSRGSALWTALGQTLDTGAGQIALEACRMADRLDEIDSVIQGRGVLDLMQFRVLSEWTDGDYAEIEVKVEFAGVLTEARQQQATFKQLIETLGAHKAVEKPSQEAGSPLDDLAKRRADRNPGAEGRGRTGVRK